MVPWYHGVGMTQCDTMLIQRHGGELEITMMIIIHMTKIHFHIVMALMLIIMSPPPLSTSP